MPTVGLPRPEDCNCFAVRSAARHVTQLYDQLLAPAGLRVTQFSILAKLKRKGLLTINVLADDMVMDRTTLGRNIRPLERDGLISIEAAASDRRAKELHLTKAGENRLRAGLEAWAKGASALRSKLGGQARGRAAHAAAGGGCQPIHAHRSRRKAVRDPVSQA